MWCSLSRITREQLGSRRTAPSATAAPPRFCCSLQAVPARGTCSILQVKLRLLWMRYLQDCSPQDFTVPAVQRSVCRQGPIPSLCLQAPGRSSCTPYRHPPPACRLLVSKMPKPVQRAPSCSCLRYRVAADPPLCAAPALRSSSSPSNVAASDVVIGTPPPSAALG
jgi:hypothetical protein